MKRSHDKRRAASEDEQIARYRYLLEALPRTVVEGAHAAAFAELSVPQRHEVRDRLRPLLSDPAPPSASSDEPAALAALVNDPQAREALLGSSVAGVVAAGFVASYPVAHYFDDGAGSVTIDQQPPWVQELVGHDSAPINAGTINHRKGVDSGHWIG